MKNTPLDLYSKQNTSPVRLAIIALFCALLAVGCGSKSPEELLLKAKELGQKGDVIGMRVTCEKIITQAPDSPAAHQARMVLAQVETQSGNLGKARKYWTEVFEKSGFDDQMGQTAYQTYLQSFVMEKNYEGALKAVDDTSATLAAYPQLQMQAERFQALVYNQMGETDKALGILKPLREEADSPGVYWLFTDDIVSVYASKKDFENAADTMKIALDEAESSSPPLSVTAPKKFVQFNMKLVNLYRQAEQNDKAIEHLRSLRENTQSEQAYVAINEQIVQTLNAEKRFIDAAKAYDAYVEKYPEGKLFYDSKTGIAFFYKRAAEETEDKDKAEAYAKQSEGIFNEVESAMKEKIEKAVLDKEKIQALGKLGQTYTLMGKDEKAIEMYESILNSTEKSQAWLTALQQIATIHINNEDFEKAITTMRTMQNKFPNTQSIQVNTEKAIEQLEKNLKDKEKFEATSKTIQSLPNLPTIDAPAE